MPPLEGAYLDEEHGTFCLCLRHVIISQNRLDAFNSQNWQVCRPA